MDLSALIISTLSFMTNYVFVFIATLAVLVFVHEYGHYWVAKMFGIHAKVFSIGLGPEVFSWTDKNDVVWRVGALPLGGYVRFWEDTDEPDRYFKKKSFMSYPAWRRIFVVLAGPAANFLLSISVFAIVVWSTGQGFLKPIIAEVMPHSAAEQAGLLVGDKIINIDGISIKDFRDISSAISGSGGKQLSMLVEREGELTSVAVVPKDIEEETEFGVVRTAMLGVRSGVGPEYVQRFPISLLDAFFVGWERCFSVVKQSFEVLYKLVSGRMFVGQLSGVIGIAAVVGSAVQVSFTDYFIVLAWLSSSIAFINLLPIPILDGGHVFFGLIEIVSGGRALPKGVQDFCWKVGFTLLLLLIVLANYNDLRNLVLSLYW